MTAPIPAGAVLLDTDAFSILQSTDPRKAQIESAVAGRIPLLSFVTVGELLRGHPLGQPEHSNDAWIAATAVAHGVPLVTGNRRHFVGARNLTVRP